MAQSQHAPQATGPLSLQLPGKAGPDMLRVAVLGAGAIAVAHLRAWASQPRARVVAVVDTEPARAHQLATDFGIESWHTDQQQMWARTQVDAVDLCLPPRLHAQAIIAYLDAGVHVLVEKPFVINLAEAAEVLAAEKASPATLMVAENWPYTPTAVRAQDLVDSGELGQVFMLRAHHDSNFYLDQPHTGMDPKLRTATAVGGYTMTAGIHTLNLAGQLMGGIDTVFATATDPAPSTEPYLDRDVVLTANFGNGGIGSLAFTGRSRHQGERRLGFALFASRGIVHFDLLSGELSSVVDARPATATDPTRSLGYVEEIAHFCACIATGATPFTCARAQLPTLATVLAVYQSLRQRTEIRPNDLLTGAGSSSAPGTERSTP